MTKKPRPSDGAPQGGRTHRLFPENAVKNLVASWEGLKKKGKAVSDGQAELLTKEAKDHHLHKKAFKDAMALLEKKSPKAEEYLVHFDHYRKILGVDTHAGLQGNLEGVRSAPGGGAAERDGEGDDAGDGDESEDGKDLRPGFLQRREADRKIQAAADKTTRTAPSTPKLN